MPLENSTLYFDVVHVQGQFDRLLAPLLRLLFRQQAARNSLRCYRHSRIVPYFHLLKNITSMSCLFLYYHIVVVIIIYNHKRE